MGAAEMLALRVRVRESVQTEKGRYDFGRVVTENPAMRDMLETARKSVAKHGLTGKITLAQGDAGRFDTGALFGLEKVDRIFMSYTLSMIPPWQEAIARAAESQSSATPFGSANVIVHMSAPMYSRSNRSGRLKSSTTASGLNWSSASTPACAEAAMRTSKPLRSR